MKNKYQILTDDYVLVQCHDFVTGDENAVFVIDHESLPIALEHDVTWANKQVSGGSNRLNHAICAKIPGHSSQIQLARLIMSCEGRNELCYNLTGNPFDLRKCNLRKFSSGEQNGQVFKQEIEERLKTMPPLPDMKQFQVEPTHTRPQEDVVTKKKKKEAAVSAKTNSIRLLTDEFSSKYVLLDGTKIALEIDQKYAKELNRQLNHLLVK